MIATSDPGFDAGRRERLAAFDRVLNILETAHEHDFEVVTPTLCSILTPLFPSATVGRSIFDLIEQVFEAQEPYMITLAIEPPRRRRVGSPVMPIGLDGRHELNTTCPIIYRSSPARFVTKAA